VGQPDKISINLYPPLTRAIDAEARRTLRPRSQIIAEVLRAAWPGYVAERLAEDLGVIDADLIEDVGEIPALTP
jgi:predicted transcriptional regulator